MSSRKHEHEWLPAVPLDLTVAWFSSVLGLKIKSVEQTRAIWGTGSKLFFTITYDDDEDGTKDRPTHICVKGMFDPAMVADQPWTISLVQQEALFFSKLAPKITRMGYPKAWWSGTSEKQGIVIMNDLTTEGCVFKKMTDTWTVDQVLEGVEQLAGLHAQYWGSSPTAPCKNKSDATLYSHGTDFSEFLGQMKTTPMTLRCSSCALRGTQRQRNGLGCPPSSRTATASTACTTSTF